MADKSQTKTGSRRPDGTIRKEIKIRPGFTPVEESQKFTSKRVAEFKPVKGYVPGLSVIESDLSDKPRNSESKNMKRNEKKKEKNPLDALQNEISQHSENFSKIQIKHQKQNETFLLNDSDETTVLGKRLKALKKKLRQIDELSSKPKDYLLTEQLEKIKNRELVEKEIFDIEQKL
ncbi:hypothetical protein HK096_011295, partial [Nowakowskiella sp. JEL0078]